MNIFNIFKKRITVTHEYTNRQLHHVKSLIELGYKAVFDVVRRVWVLAKEFVI